MMFASRTHATGVTPPWKDYILQSLLCPPQEVLRIATRAHLAQLRYVSSTRQKHKAISQTLSQIYKQLTLRTELSYTYENWFLLNYQLAAFMYYSPAVGRLAFYYRVLTTIALRTVPS